MQKNNLDHGFFKRCQLDFSSHVNSWLLLISLWVISSSTLGAQSVDIHSKLIGSWNLIVKTDERTYPAWFEIRRSGSRTLVGSYVAAGGSARPIARIDVDGANFSFTLPPQWESMTENLVFSGRYHDDKVSGQVNAPGGKPAQWTGSRAPELESDLDPLWGAPIELFNGTDQSGWVIGLKDRPNGWIVSDGVLINASPGNNLVSLEKFFDFKLRVEFRYSQGSNSGVYLRGRYEVQIEDGYDKPADKLSIGSIYGHFAPSFNAAKPAGQWQVFEITLVGRRVSVSLNGVRIIDNQIIPGMTGGALDNNEASAGPIYLQGDHGPVEYRKITIYPAL